MSFVSPYRLVLIFLAFFMSFGRLGDIKGYLQIFGEQVDFLSIRLNFKSVLGGFECLELIDE